MLDNAAVVPQQAVEPRYVEALHLAWAASRGQSLFAARCLVATALELHVRGATATDVHMSLAFAGAPPFPPDVQSFICSEKRNFYCSFKGRRRLTAGSTASGQDRI